MSHTLLLADDSVTIQRVIELTFADEDVRVVAVSDGDHAIAVMTQSPPDIVLVDAGMPGRNGYEVAEHMRRTPGLMDVPVLLLTGAFEPIDQERADAARCSGVLVKPFEPQQAIARVHELLTRPAGAVADAAVHQSSRAVGGDAARSAPSTPASVDEYFDRLDKAFAGVSGRSGSQPPGGGRSAAEDLMAWFASKTAGGDAAVGVAAATTEVPPPLADAFLALLDAERAGRDPASTMPGVKPSETLVAEVASRVLDRLSEHVVRSAVSDVVSAIAERLVQEEIDRIKAAVAQGREGA